MSAYLGDPDPLTDAEESAIVEAARAPWAASAASAALAAFDRVSADKLVELLEAAPVPAASPS